MTGQPKLAASVIAALILSTPAAFPATNNPLAGSIAGVVRNSSGVPQMGATVFLFNHSEKLLGSVLTNERGLFGFALLNPDLYSVRVSLASFVPAVKQKIAVQPGMQSLLYVDLASVLSSIELVYAKPGDGALMSDDWKWVLKESAATRPVLRMVPGDSSSDPQSRQASNQAGAGSVFSDTKGVLSVSAGDPGSLGSTSSQTDLGTAFAVATSLYGRNELLLSGNVGYSAHDGLPTAGFRTSFSRDGLGPEVAVTVQQIYLPARGGLASLAGQPDGAPALRTMSISMHDSISITDELRLDYGGSLDSVSYMNHVNSLNQFARLTYDLGAAGKVKVAYSSGAPPIALAMEPRDGEGRVPGDSEALAQDLTALATLPRLSLLDGHPAIQRSQDAEIGYEKRIRATTFNLSAYHERVNNAAITVVAPDGAFAAGDLLPDISSQNSIFDAGSYHRSGFAASVSHALGDRVQIGSSFGSGGALAPAGDDVTAPSAEALRSRLQTVQRFWASARASAKLPFTGTVITGSYQWMDYNNTIMPDHFYLTQSPYTEAGLNVRVRQPIPSVPGMPGRLEATAELQNGLAQGYLPVIEGGQRVTLVQSPRALRGGLSFIF
jgi:Carboxypeptidase regulatory-like domain/TonB dependent receptor